MTLFDINPNFFSIYSTFRTFFGELHNVRMPWLGAYGPHEEINATFRIMKNSLPAEKTINFKKTIFLTFNWISFLSKTYLCFTFLHMLLFKIYQASISDVDVMWRPWIMIGSSDFIGGLISTITGADVRSAVLLAKSAPKSFVVRIVNTRLTC